VVFVRDLWSVFRRPISEGSSLALVFGGLLGIAVAIAAVALIVAALTLPAADATVAALCGAALAAFSVAIGRVWLRTFRSEAAQQHGSP
jgi:hypothetical protein